MAKSPRKIDDVGEKIGRAAKDIRGLRLTQAAIDAMTPIEKAKRITKANLWPEPDYLALVRGGMDGAAASMLKAIYDAIASKPALRWARSSPEAQMGVIDAYTELLMKISEEAENSRTPAEILSLAKKASLIATGGVWKERLTVEETERKRSVYRAKYTNPFEVGRYAQSMAPVFGETLKPGVPAWQVGMIVRESSKKPGHFFIQSFFDNQDEMLVQALDPATGNRKTGADALSALTTGGERQRTHRYFMSREEALAVLEERHAALQAGQEATAEKKERRKPEGPITRARLETLERVGPKTRTGEVSATDLMTEFGFRGIEFGEWVPDKERRMVVNLAWDAFCDLAEVLQVEHKEIGLGGLALGFGSRGKSSAAAHYEPDLHVFNLTRMNGAGSMAHEYGHALDHYVFERSHGLKVVNSRAVMASDRSKAMPLPPGEQAVWNESIGSMFRKPLAPADFNRFAFLSFPELKTFETIERIKADPDYRVPVPKAWADSMTRRTNYAANASMSRKSDYYLSPREMYARAFESWVFDTLKGMGRQSDYLVNSVEETYSEAAGMRFNPYPEGEEREIIGGLIKDTVVSALAHQRVAAMEAGITAERERQHDRWLAVRDAEPERAAPAPLPQVTADPARAEPSPQASEPAPPADDDLRFDPSRPVSVVAWHASSVDAAMSVLVQSGYGNPRFSLTDADRDAAKHYVQQAIAEVSPDQQTPEMAEKAADTLHAMLLLDRLGVPDAVRSAAMEAIQNSGAGKIAADWIDDDHVEGVIRMAETASISPATPERPPVKIEVPEQPRASAPMQQSFNF